MMSVSYCNQFQPDNGVKPISYFGAVIRVCLLLIFFIHFISCSDNNNPAQNPLKYPKAVEQNIDSKGLEKALEILAANPDTRALIVERNGVVVQEEYLNNYSAENYFDVRSVTKSVVSLLIGIAIDKGYIQV